MILDQLFEDDKKKKLNEVDPRNYDSDEDYYAAVRGNKRSSSDDDYDYEPEDDINDMDDDESYYEKYVRTKNLEGYETTPFGSVNDQRPQMPAVPQQDREAQEQARERQARISDFREKKRDLLQQFAQLGTLRTEMIYGLENDVFLNKDQLIDFFEQQIDDPSLTALEYAYENNIPTDGLIRNILRRATQLGVSMLDVRKMFSQAKQKLGENIGRKVDAKGLTQGEWMQAVKQKFPDAKIVQAKMIDGPAHASLSDGRKIVWNPVQGVTEVGQNFRRGNARRAALNAMSPEELKAHEEKRAEQQRKRDEARLERERQRNAAKKGVAEGDQIDELSLDQIGRGIGSAARGVSRAVGGLAGGIAGIPSAVKSGYSDAKKYVGGNSKNDAVSQTDDDYKAKAKAQQPWAVAAVNPATNKQWTPDELKAQYAQTSADIAKSAAGQDLRNVMLTSPQDLDPDAVSAAQQALSPTATSTGYNASNISNIPGMQKYTKPAAPAKTPNFAQQSSGYANVGQPAVRYGAKPAAPAGTKVTAGGPTPAERKALDQRIAAAAQAQPVAETVKQVKRMMETVTSKADVQRIKDYIDYHMGNNLTESAQVKRNRLISEVTQLAATRRREIARRMAQ